MNPYIEKYKRTQKLLWAGLLGLSLPLLPLYILGTWIRSLAKNKTQSIDSLSHDAALDRLPDHHPIVRLVTDLAQKAGVATPRIFLKDPNRFFYNAEVAFNRNVPLSNQTAAIVLKGSAHLSNPKPLLTGILSHELAHLLDEPGISYRSVALYSSSTYALAGACIGGTNALHILTQGVSDTTSILNGVMVGFIALSSIIPFMARRFSHTVEHVADLRGAEIGGSENILAMQQYFQIVRDSGFGIRKRKETMVSTQSVRSVG